MSWAGSWGWQRGRRTGEGAVGSQALALLLVLLLRVVALLQELPAGL
jgi:hypothetical protein